MPLFDLKCERCGTSFEELVASEQLPVCPECGAGEVRRLYSPISPPARIGLRGVAAKRSDARRAERESARKERRAERGNKGSSG
jgi:putative FmdB family regulatory protein